LGRWERIWFGGLQPIFQSTEKIAIMLGTDMPKTVVTTVDPTQPPQEVDRNDVIRTWIRWSQANITILFDKYGNNCTTEETLDRVHCKGFITSEEKAILEQMEAGHPQALLGWQFKLLYQLFKDCKGVGSIPTQPYNVAQNPMAFGTTAVMEQLRQPFPFAYISIITMFVKFMNIAVAGAGGVLTSRSLMMHNETGAFFNLLFVVIITLLTNAICILNLNWANPLKDHFISYSADDLVTRLEKAATAGRMATILQPEVVSNKWKNPAAAGEDAAAAAAVAADPNYYDPSWAS